MSIERRCEVLIVGAGPAGIAAARAALDAGKPVTVLDDNPAPGGQIWRGERRSLDSRVTLHCSTTAVGPVDKGVLLAEREGEPLLFGYKQLILATGARELFLPFPGWTLPGVMGVGGLQSMAIGGLPIEGKRVVVAGTGPLLLAAAAHLSRRGAHVEAVVEQTPFRKLIRFASALTPGKLAQAAGLALALRGVPFFTSAWPLEAEGNKKLRAVRLHTASGEKRIPCDYLACGFGLIPNTELAALFGCEMQDAFVKVDDQQRTSAENVFCAGEPTGIGGVDCSMEEGRIAGSAAAGVPVKARRSFERFTRRLTECFALRDELKILATEDTLVCRCENVPLCAVASYSDWNSAKRQTRCGMGRCQGRVCGSALSFLLGWPTPTPRPPVVPATMKTLAAGAGSQS